MRKLILIAAVLLIAAGAWFFFGGGLDRVTEARVRTALVEAGAPPQLAECMAGRMVDDLSITQLRQLENLRPQGGESAIPTAPGEVLQRVRRVEDRRAVEMTVRAAAACSFGLPF